MLMAIVGDIIGSAHESTGNQSLKVPLFLPNSHFTDDTVCSLAVAGWLLDREEAYGEVDTDPKLASPGHWLHDLCSSHLERGYGSNFLAWLLGQPSFPSLGNGCIMRASAVAYFSDSHEEAMSLARMSVKPTHDHPESLLATQAYVWAIREAFSTRSAHAVLEGLAAKWGYDDLRGMSYETLQREHRFDITARGTLVLAAHVACTTTSSESCFRKLVAMGGDSDTLAAVAGPLCEALHGLDEDLCQHALAHQDFLFDFRFWDILKRFYAHPRVQGFYARHGRVAPDLVQWANILPSDPGILSRYDLAWKRPLLDNLGP